MSQPSPAAQPTFINLPQPPSNPDTPSEMPGTPTSTTTSLSALSTTAIKDGHRGHAFHAATGARGHHHNPSSTSLEAERADRISRLAGLSNVATLRVPAGAGYPAAQAAGASPFATPTASGMPGAAAISQAVAAGLTPAYFDASGQPVAANKMSTVGSASATDSGGGGMHARGGIDSSGGHDGDAEMADGDPDGDEDMLSLDTNYRGTEPDSASGYLGAGGPGDLDAMDEDLAERSVGGFEDRMSDDGTASLVGFGEGAGSTVSGPIYHRRPLPGPLGTAGAVAGGVAPPSSSASAMGRVWGLERSSSGLSDGAFVARRERDLPTRLAERGDRDSGVGGGSGFESPSSVSAAAMERREARMMDGVATDGGHVTEAAGAAGGRGTGGDVADGAGAVDNDDVFVDTTTRGPIPVQVAGGLGQAATSAIRETQQPHSFQHQQQEGAEQAAASREAVERMRREKLAQQREQQQQPQPGAGGSTVLSNPHEGGDHRLGQFYFEERK